MSSEVAKLQQLSLVPQNKEQFFLFLKLPSELRNLIYELVVVEYNGYIWITSLSRKKGSKKNVRSILEVNKQIRQEIIPLFYSLNTFVVGNGRFGSTRVDNEYLGIISLESSPCGYEFYFIPSTKTLTTPIPIE
ncbi:uncharacterized protein PAC_16534 [Phialocephala subalpina]|uniref:Uncharacterized protein n=1 Tax=Phialocephala subalpina TaxID=576137 RepID=A0A1L7XNM7_9HELO|nr:uncharacterized protein PAC_16534 [Phialocephala subalpina]